MSLFFSTFFISYVVFVRGIEWNLYYFLGIYFVIFIHFSKTFPTNLKQCSTQRLNTPFPFVIISSKISWNKNLHSLIYLIFTLSSYKLYLSFNFHYIPFSLHSLSLHPKPKYIAQIDQNNQLNSPNVIIFTKSYKNKNKKTEWSKQAQSYKTVLYLNTTINNPKLQEMDAKMWIITLSKLAPSASLDGDMRSQTSGSNHTMEWQQRLSASNCAFTLNYHPNKKTVISLAKTIDM